MQWVAAIAPAVAGCVLALALHSPQFLIFALLSPVVLLGSAFGDRLHWRRARRRQSAAHRRASSTARIEVESAVADERRLRRNRDPDPAAIRRLAQIPGGRLWERRRGDADLLRVRIGLADVASAVQVRRGGDTEPAAVISDVPFTVNLRAGPLGVAAPPAIRLGLLSWLVASLSTMCSPADVEFALLLSSRAAAQWRWARWLPHWSGRVASSPSEHQALVAELGRLVERRRSECRGDSCWSGSWIVVVVDGAGALNDLPGLATLLACGSQVGVTAVCADSHGNRLPVACPTVVTACGETGSRLAVRSAAGTASVVGDRVDGEWAEAVARAMAPLADPGADWSTSVPERCRLLDLLGLPEPCPEQLLSRWQRSDGRASLLLGVGADGPVQIDLARDGPHTLVAGTTGSGKSELLQTLVAGLAADHPPEEISFVLIDYKGGAAFAECARLPHTAGLVTDLDAHLTRRALQSLDCELRRREELLAAAGVADLAAYWRQLPDESLPRLALVVDEFAALAEELPDFVTGLVGIAQRGRSLGVHLVLATQRPSGGVSPEIRANSALRIALRVTDPGESCDVIEVPDAAAIDAHQPGRACLRTDQVTVLQTARVGGLAPSGDTAALSVTPLDEWRRLVISPARLDDGKTDLQLLVDAAREAALASGRSPVRRPWQPPLPVRLPSALLAHGDRDTLVPLGLVDLPGAQRQEALTLDLAAGESLLLAGGSRSGRTTALVSLAASAAARFGPDRLQLYVIDCAGGGLGPVSRLPHCATAVGGDDAASVELLLRRLAAELARRQEWLAGLGVGSAAEAIEHGHPIPLMLCLLDGWEPFQAVAEELDAGRSTERLLALVRAAPAAGMSVAIAGDRGVLAPRVAGAVPTKLLMRLADRADYGLAGVPARAVPDAMPPGRAIRTSDAAELQLAHIGHEPSRSEQERTVAEIRERYADQPPEPSAIRIRRLPERVEVASLPAAAGLVRLGLGGDGAEPVTLDLFGGAGRAVVAGPARSGRSTLLCSILSQVLDVGVELILAAAPRSGLARWAADRGLVLHGPGDPRPQLGLRSRTLLLVDDSEAFLDTAVGDALTELVRAAPAGLAAVVAARNDELAITYRGVAAEARRARSGVLLQPEASDGDLLGVRLPRRRHPGPAGRGVLVPDPGWAPALPDEPVPIQVAVP